MQMKEIFTASSYLVTLSKAIVENLLCFALKSCYKENIS